MKILIVGAGAIGNFVTIKLLEKTQHDVYLLARSNYELIKKEGINFSETEGAKVENKIIDRVFNNIKTLPKFDIVILAVRTNQNSVILPRFQQVCNEDTLIITLQNGLNFEQDILQAVPGCRLYSGTCWIKVTKLKTNHIRHDFGSNIKLGRFSNEKVEQPLEERDWVVKDLFEEAGFNVDLVTNVKSVQLTKLALNVPFFMLSALQGKSVSEILSEPEIDKKRQLLQAEIIAASSKVGSPVDVVYIENIINNLRKMQITTLESRSDFAERMKQELPQNAGSLIDFMRSCDVHLPLLENLYTTINLKKH